MENNPSNNDNNAAGGTGAPVPPAGYEPLSNEQEPRDSAIGNSAGSTANNASQAEPSSQKENACSQNEGQGSSSADFQGSQGNQPNAPQPEMPILSESETKECLSMRRFSIYAICGAFISFIFGGTLLALISLICGIVCYRKTKAFNDTHPRLKDYAAGFKKRAIIAIVVPAVALALNILAVAIVMPIILEAAQTGDYSMLLGGGATNGAVNSTWG